MLLNFGLLQSKHASQLVYKREQGKLTLIFAKIVDDLMITGPDGHAWNFLQILNDKFIFGSIKWPGNLQFLGMNLLQNNDFTNASNAEDKMFSVSKCPISWPWRKEFDDTMNQIETSAFSSVNSRMTWNQCFSILCFLFHQPLAKGTLARNGLHSRTN